MTFARTVDHDQVRFLAAKRFRPKEIARRVGCSTTYVRLIIKGKIGGSNQTLSRHDNVPLGRRMARLPAIDTPALEQGISLYHSTVNEPRGYPHALLKSGFNSSKIGRRIVKGKWKGFEVYTLTLEERATCPRSCHHWRSCFGNGMQHAHRIAHGLDLESRLISEICALANRHPGGFAIRLHVLGDFYSERYVDLWRMLLDQVPQLHVFGFSARWDCHSDPIAAALVSLVIERWDRFAIRFSNAPVDECSTVSIEHPVQKPADAVICPQQIGKTQACSTCALCWQSKRRISFLQH